MREMRLDDDQIERYSRQIVLPEIGAEGQCRLLEARVAVIGTGTGAGDLVAQLGAAGVGTVATAPALYTADGPAWAMRLTPSQDDRFDVVATLGASASDGPTGTHALWLADARIGETPPCPACTSRALSPLPACPPELSGIRDALLTAMLATEIIKRLVGVGTPRAGRVLTYDPTTASVTVESVAPDSGCARCAGSEAAEN